MVFQTFLQDYILIGVKLAPCDIMATEYMSEAEQIFLAKAQESLAGAESEFSNARYNNTANRCYYACFQAAIAALTRAGLEARGGMWGHSYVQSEFTGELVNRRKSYSSDLRDTLNQNLALRERADYRAQHITQTQALRCLRRSRRFVESIVSQGGNVK